jgi:beta-lactamase regulating signal transducer with metallopeptidase domain
MRLLNALLTSSAVQIFGWALLHSLWQGVILATLLKSILNLWKKASANARYLVSCIALLLMLVLPVLTALRANSETLAVNSGSAALRPTGQKTSATTSPGNFARNAVFETSFSNNLRLRQRAEELLPWLALIWLIGFSVSSLKLLSAWSYTRRLKLNRNHSTPNQQEILERLCSRLRVSKPVPLLESSLVKVPMVIGWIRPVILITAYCLTGLNQQQLELILAHELAHVRRHDYLVNLFQTIIETILFYHPAVWWVSKRIRIERENACDDLAVGIGDVTVYARTLIELERLRKVSASFAMAADGGSLADRIHRLIGVDAPHSKSYAGLCGVAFISILMVALAFANQNASTVKKNAGENFPLNLPALTIEDLNEGKEAAHELIDGDWTAEFYNDKPDEIHLKIEWRSARSGVSRSTNTLSIGEAEGLIPQLAAAEANVVFRIAREAGIFIFEGRFNEGKGAGFWKLTPSRSFVSDMRNRGYDNLPKNYLFYAAAENLTVRLNDGLESVGYQLSFKELIRAARYKITPESIRAWRSAGFNNLSFEELARLKEHEVTPEFLNEVKAEGFAQISPRQAVELKIHGIDRDFIWRVKAAGFSHVTLEELVNIRRREDV